MAAQDRSTMFSILLTISQKFNDMDSVQGRRVVTELVNAWNDSTAVDMYQFARKWIVENKRHDLLPLMGPA